MLSLKETYQATRRIVYREVKWLLFRPVYIFSTILITIISCIFFLSLLREGAPEKMPIAVVDLDQSSISRRVVHELNATQSVSVTCRFVTFQDARRAMQQGEIYAVLVIPERFYADMLAFKRPTLTFYINGAYTLGANTAYKQLLMFANLASGAFQREVLRKKGMAEHLIMKRIQPVAIDAHMLSNPSGNYAVYLASVILPGILGLIVLMITIYSIGSELKRKTSHEWLAEAQGSYTIAMMGKLLPHTCLYCFLGITINILLFRIMHFPLHGSFLWLNVGIVLYIIAVQMMAIMWIGAIPVMREALSFGALYGMMSFSMSGFTYPVSGMLPWMQALTQLFPLRHYYLIYVNEALMGLPLTETLPSVGKLLLFLLPALIVSRRLENALIYQNYPLK